MRDTSSTMPLSGVVVVEIGHSVAAPYAGQILGDLGAEVIKVEKPDGDDARPEPRLAPPAIGEHTALVFPEREEKHQ